MVGVVPKSAPPGFARQAANELRQDQGTMNQMVNQDLTRRGTLAGNVISNAPNIAALSGIGTVDSLLGSLSQVDPQFNTQYGQTMDLLRMKGVMANLANAQNRGRGGGGAKGPKPYAMSERDVIVQDTNTGNISVMRISEGDDARKILRLDDDGNPTDLKPLQWGPALDNSGGLLNGTGIDTSLFNYGPQRPTSGGDGEEPAIGTRFTDTKDGILKEWNGVDFIPVE